MASVVYTIAKTNWMKGLLDMDAASNIRCRLLMTNTTADTDYDSASTVGAIGTLDESDDASYAAVTPSSPTVSQQTTFSKFTTTSPISFSLTGDGTRDYQGMLMVDNVDGGTGDIPVAFIEFSGQPIPKEVTSLDVTIPTNGWISITAP